MSITHIRAALETAINGMSPALVTVWDNTEYMPVTGTPYQRVSFVTGEPENPEMGSGYQENGIMQITLFYPQKQGAAAADSRIDLIRNTFKRGTSFQHSGVTVTIQRTPSIHNPYNDGMHFAIPVKIRFFSNFL